MRSHYDEREGLFVFSFYDAPNPDAFFADRESDPAALALLQRVCLFRLGVGSATLTSIFTGEGKDDVAGPELAHLDEAGLRAKLAPLEPPQTVDQQPRGHQQHQGQRHLPDQGRR